MVTGTNGLPIGVESFINHDKDGVDRRGFLKCMAWAGTGVLWTMTGGILKSQTLGRASGAAALAAGADLSFVQISFGTSFTDEDRLFFEQIKERAVKNHQVIQTAMANPLDKFQLGIRKLIEEFMIQRMADNDKIVTRYMEDQEFQNASIPISESPAGPRHSSRCIAFAR